MPTHNLQRWAGLGLLVGDPVTSTRYFGFVLPFVYNTLMFYEHLQYFEGLRPSLLPFNEALEIIARRALIIVDKHGISKSFLVED